ncbi:MAG: GntP family permease [Selenomonadaceae bacterium]|nr:GntP family permease [Selenomonadaceae bacterium]
MGIIMIALSLVLLIFFAYRGWSIIFIAPLFAVVAAIGSGHDPMPVFSEIYMTKAAEYVKTYYPVFLLGAVFAKIMEEGGLAASVANKIVQTLGKEKAILAILIGCGVLTYGGLSVFVVAFVMYPFAAILFKEANYAKRLLPGLLWMGIFTYSMVAIPGTPQIQNIIPTAYFGTTTWAGIGLGLIGAALYFVMSWAWVSYRAKKLQAAGEGYGTNLKNEPDNSSADDLPDWKLSSIPLVMVIVLNLIISNPFGWSWAYHWDANSLDSMADLNLSLLAGSVGKVQAIWSINAALILSCIAAVIIGRKCLAAKGGIVHPINTGATGSMAAILNVASCYAFGCVVAAVPAFEMIKEALLNVSIGDGPLGSAVITTMIMCGITGSASGGETIALGMLGDQWLAMANQIGMSPEVLHRIVALASECIDTPPHSGALITLMAVCGLNHKESYYDVFVLTMLKTSVAFICLAIYAVTGII